MKQYILFLLFALLISFQMRADLVVQAESGTYTGKTDTQHSGYTGTGFVDMTNAVGSTLLLEFSIAEEMPSAVVLTRWANGKSDDRAMSFTVNGVLQINSQAFGSSGAYTTWVETCDTLSLRKGTNQLLLTALTSNGGPNIDKITIVGGTEGIKEYALTTTTQGRGTIVRIPDKPFYIEGDTVLLQAIPDTTASALFIGWSGDTVSSSDCIQMVIGKTTSVVASFRSAVHTTYYCAPTEGGGLDTNVGSIESPFFNLSKAIDLMQAGDTVYLRGGTYRYSATIALSSSGSEAEYFCIFNYPGEKPILNFYDILSNYTTVDETARGAGRGFKITGNYYHLKGLEICQAPDNGIKVEGSYNIMEQLVLHHNGDSGIQTGLSKNAADAADVVCHNLVKNCDSYRNFDWGTGYENADGFACKLSPGANNRYVGCRSWENSDDGWDFYMTHYTIYIDSCWTMGNGNPALITTSDPDWEYGVKNTAPTSFSGDGNGFKLGGDDWAAKHQLRNCIAFNGYSTGAGFSENNNADSLFIFNCLSWQNMKNFRVRAYPSDLRNCISFDPKVSGQSQFYDLATGTTEKNNSWDSIQGAAPLVPVKNFDQSTVYNQFISTSAVDFLASREADGSLPKNGFGRLKAGSMFIDKGTNIVRGMDSNTLKSYDIALTGFYGTSVDLGAYEYVPDEVSVQTPSPSSQSISVYPNPLRGNVCFEVVAFETGKARLVLLDITGRLVYDFGTRDASSGEKQTFSFQAEKLQPGVYWGLFSNGSHQEIIKLVK
jgi:pectate disaccharide-lyase